MSKNKKVDDKILEIVPEIVFQGGLDYIGSNVEEFLDEEAFAEEKAAERKAAREKKRTTKEFGEW